METSPCLQEVEMIFLSGNIPHTSYSKLCNALGYSYDWYQSILANHRGNYNEAMTEILIKWNTKQTDTSRSRSILAKKLHDVELGGLGKKLSEGEYLPRQQEPPEQEATPLQSIPDIYSEKISESLTVQQCREKLENKYLNQLCKIQMKPWDHTDYAEFEDMHTVVTMVKKDAHGKDTKKKEILQGSVAEIFSTKVNGRLPARILISAPAGRGKTTAVAKIAYDWVRRERGSALEHLPLLFVVKFRNTSQLTSIGEAIKSQLLSDVDDLTPEGLESFIRKNQGICHIILDGLDEYAGISSSQSSPLSNIVSVIRWKEFPECRVLVTTRPHLENFFNQHDLPRVYTKMWIEGFSRESSCEYIDKFFVSNSNLCDGQSLKDYLDEQPLIDELVKTPLFCLMICHVWSEGLLDIDTTTQTELLDRVNIFLMHYANERSKSRVKITPEHLKKIISQIGEVALTGLLDDAKKLLFTPHDFRKVPAILDGACELGLVSKTTVYIKCLPQSNETTSTTIEFYHKLAQEHSAGKFLADQTYHFLLRLKISKLDKVLHKIKANIGDYENLIRFVAGSDNILCIRIMEAVLANSSLNESERYRVILDCSSETKGTEGNVSSLVQRCVNAQSIILKAPTVYTVVGIQNLPKQLKREVRSVKFEGSTLTTDVTSGLWSCLESFSMLHTLTISDSSISLPQSPPELLSITKLSAGRVTSQSYEGLLSSLPSLKDVDIIIGDANTEDISRIQTSLRRHLMGHDLTHINPHAFTSEGNVLSMSRKRMRGLGLLIIECQAILSGIVFGSTETVIDFVKSSTRLMSSSMYAKQFFTSLDSDHDAVHIDMWTIKDCQLSTEMTDKLWTSLRSFTKLNQLTISDSSLSFSPSPPELPSVTKLSAESVTSQSYEGVLSSIPGVRDIDVSIDVAKTSSTFQITTDSRPISHTRARDKQFLVHIRLQAWPVFTTCRYIESGEEIGELSLLFRDQTRNQQRLHVSGVKGRDEEALVDLFVKTKQLTYLNTGSGGGSLNEENGVQNTTLEIEQCQLSTKMTEQLWFSLRSFTKLNQLTIYDSSLSFSPSPPELPFVTKLSAENVTAQSYAGVLSSIPGVRDLDVSIDVAETSSTFQITAASRPTSQTRARDEQFVVHIRLHDWQALTTYRNIESGEEIGGLSLLFEDQNKNQQRLHVSGVKGRDEEALVDLFVKTKQLTYLNTGSGGGSLNGENGVQNTTLEIEQCQLSTKMTEKLWSSLRSLTPLNQLTIADSSLSFPPSPPELPSVTKLSAKKVTSQSYEGVLSSIPGVRNIDASIDVAEKSNTYQITAASRPMSQTRASDEQFFVHIRLHTWPALTTDRKIESGETVGGLSLLIEDQTKYQQRLHVYGVNGRDEKAFVDLFVKTKRLTYLNSGSGFLNKKNAVQNSSLQIKQCQLSTEMTEKLWLSLRSYSTLNQLTISDSSLSFPPSPPELPSVTKLSVEKLTSQSYAGVLSSVPGVRDIDVSIDVAETSNTYQITTDSRPISHTRARDEQFVAHIRLQAWPALTTDRKIESGETIGGLSLLKTKDQHRLQVSGVKGRDEEALVDLFVKTNQLTYLNSGSGGGSLNKKNAVQNTRLEIQQCQLSTELTAMMWFCLSSFTSLLQLTISDSSLSFPLSPPELPSVTQLSAQRVTSQSYEGLLSSLPGLEEVDITIGDANTEDISQIQTSLRRHLTGQDLTCINPHSIASEENVSSMSTQRMRGLGLLFNRNQAILAGVVFGPNETVIDLVQSSMRLMSASLYLEQLCRSLNSDQDSLHNTRLEIEHCQLSTKMTEKLWSSLRSYTSMNQLTISDSSLSFPPSSPELPFITKLSAEKVTSQSYEGVLPTIPGVRDIDVSIDISEKSNTFQITTASKTTSQTRVRDEHFFVHIRLHAWPAITTERKIESKETIGGLSLLFRDQTWNQQRLHVSGVKGRDEEALVDLFVKTKQLTYLNSGNGYGSLNRKNGVQFTRLDMEQCQLSTEMTDKLWSSLRSLIPLNQLIISDSSLSFPPSPPELSYVTELSVDRVTSQSYGGLLSSLPGLREIYITIGDAERDIPQITTSLLRTGTQQLAHIKLSAPPSLPLEKKSVSRETLRGLGLLIREQTKHLYSLSLSQVKCLDEGDLIELIECCRRAKTRSKVWFHWCGTMESGRLESYLLEPRTSSSGGLSLLVHHDEESWESKSDFISHID